MLFVKRFHTNFWNLLKRALLLWNLLMNNTPTINQGTALTRGNLLHWTLVPFINLLKDELSTDQEMLVALSERDEKFRRLKVSLKNSV